MFRRESVDRLPYFDLLTNDAVIEHYAGEALTYENAHNVVVKALDNLVDATRGAILTPQKEETRTLPDGSVHEQKRWTGWTKRPAGFGVREAAEVLEKAIGDLEWSADAEKGARQSEEEYFQTRGEFHNAYLCANFGRKTGIGVYATVGLTNFSYLMADRPELIRRYLDAHTNWAVRGVEAMKRLQEVEVVFSGEDVAAGQLLFSPEFLRREFIPRLERIIDAYHRAGVKFLFHSDGNLMEIIDDLVAAGIDALNPLETKAGMDLAEIRRRHPDLVLVGGIDCSSVLPFGTVEDVRKETLKCIEEALPWYLPGSSSEIHNEIPLSNVQAMVDTIRSFRL